MNKCNYKLIHKAFNKQSCTELELALSKTKHQARRFRSTNFILDVNKDIDRIRDMEGEITSGYATR